MSWWQPLRRLIPYALASGLLVGLQQTPLVENANLLIYDLALQLRSSQHQTNEQDELAWPITVVGISERDLKRYSWPLEDTLLCEALQRLDALGAVAIGLDLYRDQAHVCLQEEVQRNPRLISGDQPGVALHFLLQTNMRLIAIQIQPDGNGAQCIQPLQGFTEQGVLQRPAVALQVAFADSHDRYRPCQLVLFVGLVLAAAQLQSQVIDEQVGVFHQRGLLKSHQQARGKGIGDQPPQGLPPAHALGSERLNSFCMRAMSALRRESSRFS